MFPPVSLLPSSSPVGKKLWNPTSVLRVPGGRGAMVIPSGNDVVLDSADALVGLLGL